MPKDDLIRSIDLILHTIMTTDADTETHTLAENAHAALHDLAGLLSDDPAIRATAAAAHP